MFNNPYQCRSWFIFDHPYTCIYFYSQSPIYQCRSIFADRLCIIKKTHVDMNIYIIQWIRRVCGKIFILGTRKIIPTSTGVRKYSQRVDVIYDVGHYVTYRTIGVTLNVWIGYSDWFYFIYVERNIKYQHQKRFWKPIFLYFIFILPL